ncbi:TetR/AcrR family transcriptional regulator [Nonomuraea sp. NPDC049709]|uniref:TetR/AcrR family transcriptional regulator n=1 Tax=Nonomuraea sp. NPDC049709 TaxID=3154736 RepID=UPI00341C7D7C
MMAAGEISPGTVRVGRPRDPAIDVAVLEATLAALFSVGYTRLSLEDVARQAGTTKPAIRRRWPGRSHLVLAALGSRLGAIKAPDTGCTLCDLDECLKLFARAFRCISPDVLGPLLADCAGDPELRQTFMTTLFDPPRTAVQRTLARAYERGDLREEVDPAIVLDLLGSFVYYRVLFSHLPIDDREIEHAVETLLRGVARDYKQLLEHSRRTSATSEMHSLHA